MDMWWMTTVVVVWLNWLPWQLWEVLQQPRDIGWQLLCCDKGKGMPANEICIAIQVWLGLHGGTEITRQHYMENHWTPVEELYYREEPCQHQSKGPHECSCLWVKINICARNCLCGLQSWPYYWLIIYKNFVVTCLVQPSKAKGQTGNGEGTTFVKWSYALHSPSVMYMSDTAFIWKSIEAIMLKLCTLSQP